MAKGYTTKRNKKTSKGKPYLRWYGIVPLPNDPETGQRRLRETSGFAREREAKTALTLLEAEVAAETPARGTSITLRNYLDRHWLPTSKARIKATTYRGYEWMTGRYVVPLLGDVRLIELTTADINTAYARLLSGDLPVAPRRTRREPPAVSSSSAGPVPHPRINRPLSAKTVHNVHLLLRKVLADAVDEDLLVRNPAERAKPPRPIAPDIEAWSAEELRTFLQGIAGQHDYALFRTLAMTGVRRGEILGLRWQDLDLDATSPTLVVRQSLVLVGPTETAFTKPKNGRARVVDLDDDTALALRHHRAQLGEHRLGFGPGYHQSKLVFPSFDGGPANPDAVSKRFGTLRDQLLRTGAVKTRISLHGLRHTHATIALAAGVHVKIISERLGHSNPAFTMSVYQHALPTMQREAARVIAALVAPCTTASDVSAGA